MRSMLDVRYNLVATVLNDYAPQSGKDVDGEVKGGHWETIQDPDTNAITRVWVEDQTVPNLPGRDTNVNINRFDIECSVIGVRTSGANSRANEEVFVNGEYKLMELLQMNFPAKYILNRRQFITNIRNVNKHILWLEEETGQPTVFEVQGVTPTFDPFGRHIDNLAILKRSEVQ